MLLVAFFLVISMPLARNQRIINGPKVCNPMCGFGAHVQFEASLSIKGKQIHIPEDADVSLECNVSAPDVQKIKIVWTSPNVWSTSSTAPTISITTHLTEASSPQTIPTSIVTEETTLPLTLLVNSTYSKNLSTVTEYPVSITTQNGVDSTSQLPTSRESGMTSEANNSEDEGTTAASSISEMTTMDARSTPGAVSTETVTQTTNTGAITTISSTLNSISNSDAGQSTLSPETETDRTISDVIFESSTSLYSSTTPPDSSEINSDSSTTVDTTFGSETYSTTLRDPFKAMTADFVAGNPYESSGESGSNLVFDPSSIDSVDESLLEIQSTPSDEILWLTPTSHLRRVSRQVLDKKERLTEKQTENKLELWFQNESTKHYLSKITITVQSDVTGDSTTNFIIPFCERRMEAPYDYKYECSSEQFDLGDSAVLLLQNIAIAAFSDGNCTLNKSKLCGQNDTNDTEESRPMKAVIIAGTLIGAFSFAGVVWITFGKVLRRWRSKHSESAL